MPPPSPFAPAPGAPPNEPLAIWALVAGIVGVLTCLIPAAIAAIILGIMSSRKIKESGGYLGGQTMALWGQILGWVGAALFIIVIIIYIVAFSAAVVTRTPGY